MSGLDSPSRSWWPSSNPRHPSEKLKAKSSLNTLVSAFGFKPKKSPTITTEDPLLPIQPPPPSEYPTNGRVGNRPPSKSISSTVSRAESSEPKTPSDSNHNAARHSLLTLSDVDPFAGRGVVTIASPTGDPTRLSAYSTNSIPDLPQPKYDDRISYASSSSQSHSHGSHAEYSPGKKAVTPLSPPESFSGRRLFKKASANNLTRSHSYTPSDVSVRTAPVQPTLHKSPSSLTLMSPTSRPSMRPRGLTDNGTVQKSGFFVHSSPKPSLSTLSSVQHPPPSSAKPLSPRVVVRQASVQRLNQPPAAPPPRHGLPAPPSQSPQKNTESGPYRLAPSHSTASSTISFASSADSADNYQPLSPMVSRERPRLMSNKSIFSSSASEVAKEGSSLSSPPMSLKKALSHQSLRRRVSPSAGGSSTPERAEKTPSKRGFPQFPLPPLPSLSLRTSNATLSAAASEQYASPTDQRISTASSKGGGRRRLFSGSSMKKASSSISARGDDDNQSVFSLQSDQDVYFNPVFFKPWVATQGPPSPSQLEQAKPDTAPSSPICGYGGFATQQSQYPQSVGSLSPPHRGELSLSRPRGLSIRSSDSMFSDHDPDQPIRGGEPMRRFQRSNTLSLRAQLQGDFTRRPSTAQPAFPPPSPVETVDESIPDAAVPDPIEQTFTPSTSPPPVIMRSLPPPPRRARPAPPPEPDTAPIPVPSVAIPPPRPPRRKMPKSIEKGLHRRSIMRKPSFLDIDDESEEEVIGIPPGSDIGDSFIDFARESFDTVRSDD